MNARRRAQVLLQHVAAAVPSPLLRTAVALLHPHAAAAADGDDAQRKQSALAKYGRDLTADAEAGRIEPIIGRDQELRRLMHVLAKKTKNNPLILGEPGVGKTALVEGLARAIALGEAPAALLNKRVIAVDLPGLVAGTKFRGDFEERLKRFLAEVMAHRDRYILFIDEVHSLVGSGQSSEQGIDAGSILKPPLARGELHCIGATTYDEYRKHILKDGALERRFQPIELKEPSVDDTVHILRALKPYLERHHGVHIRDEAVLAAARLSDRYIRDRHLPDKAIDLLDEACARVRLDVDSAPNDLQAALRRLSNARSELASLERELHHGVPETVARVDALRRGVAKLSEEAHALYTAWRGARTTARAHLERNRTLESSYANLQDAEADLDLAKMAELRYHELPRLLGDSAAASARAAEAASPALLAAHVDEEAIAMMVSSWTKVPIARVLEGEQQKLLELEQRLHQFLVGQEEAVTAVSGAIRRARMGVSDGTRPIGSFLFLGPSGVGKSELARVLARVLFDDEKALIRLDMSEFMEKHTVSRLIGAPPGYVGYDESGQLCERVRKQPYSVVLFDEVEKAHLDVLNVLLQIMDRGMLTDNHGRETSFRSTVVILTSNVGSSVIYDAYRKHPDLVPDSADHEEMRQQVLKSLQSTFRPEFLNRLDDVVLFRALSRENLLSIVDVLLGKFAPFLQSRRLTLELDESMKTFLVEKGYDPKRGARLLQRALQTYVLDAVSAQLLRGSVQAGDHLVAGLDTSAGAGGRVTLRRRRAKRATQRDGDLAAVAP